MLMKKLSEGDERRLRNFLTNKRFDKDRLSEKEINVVMGIPEMCELLMEHIEQVKGVSNGKCANIKQMAE